MRDNERVGYWETNGKAWRLVRIACLFSGNLRMEAARWNRLDRICGMESALAVKIRATFSNEKRQTSWQKNCNSWADRSDGCRGRQPSQWWPSSRQIIVEGATCLAHFYGPVWKLWIRPRWAIWLRFSDFSSCRLTCLSAWRYWRRSMSPLSWSFLTSKT